MKVVNAFIYGLVSHSFLQRLKRHFALQYEPYYIVREGHRQPEAGWPSLPEGFSTAIVEADTAYIVVGVAPWLTDEAVMRRFRNGHKCVVVEHPDMGTVGCTWANSAQINNRTTSYVLAPNEAYLYDAFVRETARGKGLAPAMRAVSYQHLARYGYTGFVSISDKFNTSSLKFKGRLGAEIVAAYEFLGIGGYTLFHFRRPTKRVLPT